MICIAGTPRSGTSLVAQILSRAGVWLGPPQQIVQATSDNRDGFWENREFVAVNEQLLAASGATWFDPPETLRPTVPIETRARDLVRQFEGREPWAWKDPRNSITLPFWKRLLPGVKVLICVRHPAESIESLAVSRLWPPRHRAAWRMEHGIVKRAATALSSRRFQALQRRISSGLWNTYHSRAWDDSQDVPRLVTHYDAHFTRPRAEIERLLSFAGVAADEATLDELTRIASPRFRHHRAPAARIEPQTERLYRALCDAAEYVDERDAQR